MGNFELLSSYSGDSKPPSVLACVFMLDQRVSKENTTVRRRENPNQSYFLYLRPSRESFFGKQSSS